MRRRVVAAAAALAALLLGGSVPTQEPAPLCGPGGEARIRPSQGLYCFELVARPDVPTTATAMVELGRAESPFDVATNRIGNQRFDASVLLSGYRLRARSAPTPPTSRGSLLRRSIR